MTERYRYGATPAEWRWAQHFAPNDLLASVGDLEILNNPDTKFVYQAALLQPHERSGIAKHPSLIFADGVTVSLQKGWSKRVTTAYDVDQWIKDPALNCLVHCRNLRALDVDVEEPGLADWVERVFFQHMGIMPTRFRANSSKRAHFFFVAPTLHMKRKILELREDRSNPDAIKKQMIEFRGNGNETVMFGTHPSGARLQWRNCENGVPTVPVERLIAAWEAIRQYFPSDKNSKQSIVTNEEQRDGFLTSLGKIDHTGGDPVVPFLESNGFIRNVVEAGKYALHCPRPHNSPNGVSDTIWQEAGPSQPHGYFKCQHNGCSDLDTPAFLELSGYNAWAAGEAFTAQAKAKAAEQPVEQQTTALQTVVTDQTGPVAALSKGTVAEYNPGLGLRRDSKGAMKKQFANIADIARSDNSAFRVKLDTFKQNTAIAYGGSELFKELTDNDLSMVREIVERRYDVSYSAADVSAALGAASVRNSYDSAIEWIDEQKHDGVDRISRFAVDILKTHHTPYTHAVSWYLWVAMVGRAISIEGVKADMVVTLISPNQGTGKSTLIKSLVPNEEWTTRIDLSKSDDDIARLLRGTVVVELPELKGFHARDNEAMKAFLDREKEHYVPKYKEFSTSFARRCLFIGSHNKRRYLTDPTGNRRHLPISVAETDEFLDWPKLKTELGQYWAQARDYIKGFPSVLDAVEAVSAHALSLAGEAQMNATMFDPWYPAITEFVRRQTPGTVISLGAVASGILSGGLTALDFARAARIRNVMTMARYQDHGADAWIVPHVKI